MGFARNVWIPGSTVLVLWACATSKIPDSEKGSGGAGSGGRGGASSGGSKVTGGTLSASGGSATASGGSPSSTGGSASASGGANAMSTGGVSLTGGAGGVPASVLERASVILHYATNEPNASTQKIHMNLFLENQSSDPLPLANVAIRYWMTSEVSPPTLHNYYTGPSILGEKQTFVDDGDDSYVELTFTGTSIARGADLNASEMQLDVDGGSYDQSDDWSFQPAFSARTPHDRVTVYLADKLIWGCEPSGTCAGAGAGGAGGQGGAGGAGGQAGAAGSSNTGGGGGAGGAGAEGGASSEGGSGPDSGGAGGQSTEGGTGAVAGSSSEGGAAGNG